MAPGAPRPEPVGARLQGQPPRHHESRHRRLSGRQPTPSRQRSRPRWGTVDTGTGDPDEGVGCATQLRSFGACISPGRGRSRPRVPLCSAGSSRDHYTMLSGQEPSRSRAEGIRSDRNSQTCREAHGRCIDPPTRPFRHVQASHRVPAAPPTLGWVPPGAMTPAIVRFFALRGRGGQTQRSRIERRPPGPRSSRASGVRGACTRSGGSPRDPRAGAWRVG